MNQPLTNQVKVTITAQISFPDVLALELDEAGFLQFTTHSTRQELMMSTIYSQRTESSKSKIL